MYRDFEDFKKSLKKLEQQYRCGLALNDFYGKNTSTKIKNIQKYQGQLLLLNNVI